MMNSVVASWGRWSLFLFIYLVIIFFSVCIVSRVTKMLIVLWPLWKIWEYYCSSIICKCVFRSVCTYSDLCVCVIRFVCVEPHCTRPLQLPLRVMSPQEVGPTFSDLCTHLQIGLHIYRCLYIYRSVCAFADLFSLSNLNTDLQIFSFFFFFTHARICIHTHRSEYTHRSRYTFANDIATIITHRKKTKAKMCSDIIIAIKLYYQLQLKKIWQSGCGVMIVAPRTTSSLSVCRSSLKVTQNDGRWSGDR